MKKIINVTERDIQYGLPGESRACAVYRAVKRKYPGVRAVTPFYIRGANHEEFYVPTEVTRFIKRFDSGENVEPFTFTLEVPE